MDHLHEILSSPSKVIFFSLDKDYQYLIFNQNHKNTMNHIWGVEIEKGQSMLAYISSEQDRKKAKSNFDRALAGEEFTVVEEYGDENINRFFYEDFYSPLKNDKDEIIGLTVYVIDVTDRMKTARKVEENENLLKSINKNLSEGIFHSDMNGMVYVNEAFARMFGYETPEEMYQIKISDIYEDPADRNTLIEVLKSDSSYEKREVNFRKKNGSVFVGLLSCKSYTDEHGNLYWDGSISDVTLLKESERKIRENEQLLKSINHNINDAIYRSEEGKGIIYVNDAFVKMFGYSDFNEIKQVHPSMLYANPKDRDLLGDLLVEKGLVSDMEVQFQRKDGSLFWGSLSSICAYHNDQMIIYDGAIRDITVQKEIKEKVKRQAEMKDILMNISMNYLSIPIEDIPLEINKSLEMIANFASADRAYSYDIVEERTSGKGTEEWCAAGVASLKENDQDFPVQIFKVISAHFAKGAPIVFSDTTEVKLDEYQQFLKRHQIKSLVTVPIMFDGNCMGYVGLHFVHDYQEIKEDVIEILTLFAEIMVLIINRIKSRKELDNLLDVKTRQNERLKDFSFILSHNIRASVANLMGLLNIQKEQPANSEINEMLSKTADRLNITLFNMSELINLEKDIENLTLVDCDVLWHLHHSIELNKSVVDNKSADIQIDSPDQVVVKGFPAFLDSIFNNLITNALKYGVEGDSNQIEIKVSMHGSRCLVEVKDYGLGIDLPRHEDKLFKLGARFHSEYADGQGLGLYMTKKQVEALGGEIAVESELNRGSTFKVWLNV